MYCSVALNTFLWLCNHHHHSPPELFSFCKSETLCLLNNNSPLSSSFRPGHHHFLLCLYKFYNSMSTYKWNHTVLVFSWLINFTEHNVLKIHLCCTIGQNFFLVKLNTCYILSVLSSIYRLLGCFLLCVVVNGAAINMGDHLFKTNFFNSFEYILRSEIAGPYHNSIFNFLRTAILFSTDFASFYIQKSNYFFLNL